jgi:hypothetical protein
MTISQGEADSFLVTDTEHASNAVMALVCDCHWNFNQFDAMVSLAFNIGGHSFRSSTVLRQHRAGNYPYRVGTDELSEERRETERAWRSLPVEEQMRIYDAFDAARTRLNAPIETTATVTSGPDNRNPDVEPPAADDET